MLNISSIRAARLKTCKNHLEASHLHGFLHVPLGNYIFKYSTSLSSFNEQRDTKFLLSTLFSQSLFGGLYSYLILEVQYSC